EGDSLGAIVEGLRACEGCPEDIDARMEAFISQLFAKEVLVGDPDGGNETAPAFEKTAFEDGFTLTLDEYAEAMDLILADPIHDVDVDMGWPIMKES
ncbi:MAG: hypothetical protein IJH87_03405, partial [Atopobiaceae bacterium]|nr:hypothetical protein [Atopobiaceae bacterium]